MRRDATRHMVFGCAWVSGGDAGATAVADARDAVGPVDGEFHLHLAVGDGRGRDGGGGGVSVEGAGQSGR